jgi:2-keto-4-pentenoate hydratase/2-oxohepta-3-ene-1,7-dioic acid hydratase in catechol pathway
MKLLSFEIAGKERFGAVAGDGVIDLTGRLGAEISTLRALLDAGLVGRAAELVDKCKAEFALAEVKFLTPVPFPEKIICVGVNYGNRNAEYKDGSDLPKYPSIFLRFPGSFVGHHANLMRPPESVQLDYEGEIAIVIGKKGRRIEERDAESHIAGLTCMNEGTIRDWLRHGKFNVTQGKNFDRTGAYGPWLVTADEFKSFDDIRVKTRVNGEERQNDTTANLMFPFRHLIRYISTWTTLKPGDVIATGTPVGAGVRFDPPRFLTAGDTVEVEVSGIGTLSNTVADEKWEITC